MARNQPEMALQTAVRDLLTVAGYTVMETGKGRSRVQCPSCGTRSYARGWQGNTVGLPDVYVHRPGIGGIGIALELKSPKGKPSEAQKALADAGMTCIVRTVAEAIRAVARVELMLGNSTQVEKLRGILTMNGWTNEQPETS